MRTVLPAPNAAWAVLTAVLVFHLLLISLTSGHRAGTSILRAGLLDGLAAMERLADRTLGGVGSVWTNYVALVDLRAENNRLRAQNDELRMRWTRRSEDLLEADRLRRMAGLESAGLGKTLVARVIGKDASIGRQTLTLDRGRSSGIRIDTSVITPEGVVGRVIIVAEFSSIAQLIVDPQAGIGVLIGSARQQGNLTGDGSGLLDLDYSDDDSLLKEGDAVVTSGLDKIHQKGLPVGTVISVEPPDDGGQIKKFRVRTAVDFGRIEEVLCVIDPAPPAADSTPAPQSGPP